MRLPSPSSRASATVSIGINWWCWGLTEILQALPFAPMSMPWPEWSIPPSPMSWSMAIPVPEAIGPEAVDVMCMSWSIWSILSMYRIV